MAIAKGDTVGEYLRDSTRWLHVYVTLGDGRTGMNLQVIYGHASDKEANVRLMNALWEYTTRLGNTPSVVTGDFNVSLNEPLGLPPSMADTLCLGTYVDLDALHSTTHGVPTQSSCMTANSIRSTRIDGMFADQCTAAGLQKVEALDTSFPTHTAVRYVLALAQAKQEVRKSRRLLDLEFTRNLDEKEQEAIAGEACRPQLAEFRRMVTEKDVEGAMKLWSLMAETTWVKLADPGQPLRGTTGRCSTTMHIMTTMQTRHHTKCGKPMTQVLTAVSKASAGLRPLLRHLRRGTPGVPPWEAVLQWRASLKHQRLAMALDPAISWPPLPPSDDLPSLDEVTAMHKRLEAYSLRRLDQDDRGRLKAFRTRQQEAWYGGSGRGIVYKWVKEETWSAVAFVLARPDGTPTANVNEMDVLLHAAWDPILCRYAPQTARAEPSADLFMEKYGHLVRKMRCDMTVRPLSAKRLMEQLKRTSPKKATGLDGWAVANLKRLPRYVLGLLATFLNLVEEVGRWPSALTEGYITLIPKGEGMEPTSMRPLSVLSAIYRLWAGVRLRDVIVWQEAWIHPNAYGFRRGKGTGDAYSLLAAIVELARLRGEDLDVVGLDYVKCFDRVPQEVVLRLAMELGMDPRLCRALAGMYQELKRRFKVKAVLAPPSTPRTSSFKAAPCRWPSSTC